MGNYVYFILVYTNTTTLVASYYAVMYLIRLQIYMLIRELWWTNAGWYLPHLQDMFLNYFHVLNVGIEREDKGESGSNARLHLKEHLNWILKDVLRDQKRKKIEKRLGRNWRRKCFVNQGQSMESRLILGSLNALKCSVIKLAKFTHPLISGVANFM